MSGCNNCVVEMWLEWRSWADKAVREGGHDVGLCIQCWYSVFILMMSSGKVPANHKPLPPRDCWRSKQTLHTMHTLLILTTGDQLRCHLTQYRPVARISKGGGREFEKLDLFVPRCVEEEKFVEPPPKKGGLGVLPQKILKTEMLLDALWCIIL